MRLITNDNYSPFGGKNHMESCLLEVAKNRSVDIAVAFFTDTQTNLLRKMIENGCYVRLIVRLNYGTSPDALLKIIDYPNTQIRFFTSKHFHPKMYIVENSKAYIGSSNFTDSGLRRNQEVNVEIDSEEFDFESLYDVFNRYWDEAQVLEKSTIKQFKNIITENPQGRNDASVFLKNTIGESEYKNVSGDKPKTNNWQYYSSEFKRVYQEFLSAFEKLSRIYIEHGKRRFDSSFPIRIEIDRFLWWIREYKAKGESYKGVQREPDENKLRDKILPLIDEFVVATVPYLDRKAEADYYAVRNGFSSIDTLEKLDFEELFETLTHVHAFNDCQRYTLGGRPAQKENFTTKNSLDDVKKLIVHLIYDDGDYIRRIYDCCRNPSYKIAGFGDACVTELYGIMNQDNIPIRNGRIEKSLEWLGFGVV